MPDGTEKPVSYASRTLSKVEINYSQIEKEVVAIIYAVKKKTSVSIWITLCLLTDHKPLGAFICRETYSVYGGCTN